MTLLRSYNMRLTLPRGLMELTVTAKVLSSRKRGEGKQDT
jgi:hypothetical protein